MTPSRSQPPTAPCDGGIAFELFCSYSEVPDRAISAESLSQWVHSGARFPEIGSEFLGFHIERELGRGAFGRVYLARQGDLAGRPVALKIACDIGGESQALAQMQHTNIVPIYSFHRAGAFQAVCMPYYGRVTLAEVLRHLQGRDSLPSSGRELRSTVVPHDEGSAPSAGSIPPAVDPTPTPGALPSLPAPPTVPTSAAHDGWARLEGLPYVEAVLTLVGQLADGLAHAHARGILHRDLKPANVLLTDEGHPMLLDFNLAEDTKERTDAERAAVGGTLPYMAPEQMRAFRDRTGSLDARSDLYALGVILFELLTGKRPFPRRSGFTRPVLEDMLTDRERGAPSPRAHNRAVSPAVDAVVRKCLAANPAERYQRAEDLRTDIDRHLNNQSLVHAPNPSVWERVGKWARRHPRLSSSGTVGALAALVVLVLGAGAVYSWDRGRDLSTRATFADHRTEFADAQLFLDDRNQSGAHLDEADARLCAVLARYAVPDDGADAWTARADVRRLSEADRAQLRGDIAETFYLRAQVAYVRALGSDDPGAQTDYLDRAARWGDIAARYAGDRFPRAAQEQRAAVAELRGSRAEAEALRTGAAQLPSGSARDLYLLGALYTQRGHHREALPHLRRSTYLDPKNFSAWFVRGTAHAALDQYGEAVTCFTACLALRADFAPAWRNRALARVQLREYRDARDDLSRAIELTPSPAALYIERASTREVEGDLEGAEADLTAALDAGGQPVRVHLLRAAVRDRREDDAGARADREQGLRLAPDGELDWLARGIARAGAEPAGALADADEALKCNAFSVTALQLKAHLLGERLGRPDDALAVLNRAVELHPDHVPLRAGRGVELARRGKRDEALRDARGPRPRPGPREPVPGRVHLRAHVQGARGGQEGSAAPDLVGAQGRVRVRPDRHRRRSRGPAERPRVYENGCRGPCALDREGRLTAPLRPTAVTAWTGET
jgi:serine/threonine protein kinase/Flp pilus assembly protein TadD